MENPPLHIPGFFRIHKSSAVRLVFILCFNLFLFTGYSQSFTSSLTACYALDGNGNEPINNLTASLSAVTATVDRFNNSNSAYAFSGSSSSYIYLPNNSLLKPSTGVSFSAWVKFNNTNNQYVVFAQNTCSSYHEGYTLAGYNNGSFRLLAVKSATNCSPSTQPLLAGNTVLSTNTWYHVGMYVGNDSMKLYLNGAPDGAMSSTVVLNYNSSQYVYLGGSGVSFNVPLNGSLDNVKFYNRKLSNAEFNLLYTADPPCTAPPPNCGNTLYEINGGSSSSSPTLQVANLTTPTTSTMSPAIMPVNALGLAIGPSFGFTAPSPTYWTTVSGTYWYYNGTTFINTGHTTGNSNAINPGGSKNYIYNMDGSTGNVYKYNGTGNASLLMTVPSFTNGAMAFDVAGDDNDNFYLLQTLSPQSLNVYSSSGVLTCTYAISGLPSSFGGSGFAISGNTVMVEYGGMLNYVGTLSGSSVTFSATSGSLFVPNDFATCARTTAFTSTITASPSASVSCATQTITLTANGSTPGSLTYTWSGPGIVSGINNQTVQVNAAGVYTVLLKSCPGGTSMATFTVLNGPSVLTLTVNPSGALRCLPASAITLSASGATNYTWSPSASLSSSTGAVVSASPGSTTIYTVSGVTGLCTGSTMVTITVGTTPTLTNTGGNPTICAGTPTTLSLSGATNYTWSPGGMTGATATVNPSSTTAYTIIGANGNCTSAINVTVTVLSVPVLSASASPTVICQGSSSTLTANNSTAYVWNPGNFTGPTVFVSPTVNTTYTVVGTNSLGCSSTSLVAVNVNLNPTITVSPPSPTICAGRSQTLTAGGASTYTWSPGNFTTSAIVVTPGTNTAYTVQGRQNNCPGNTTVQVVVSPSPAISATASPNSICAMSSSTITASGANTYTWQPGGATGFSVIVSPSVSSIYTVTGTDILGCTGSATASISIINPPIVSISANPNPVCNGSTTTLTASGASNYSWQPGGSTSSLIVVSPTTSTTYTLIGYASSGCSATTVMSLSVLPSPTVSVQASPSVICVGSSATLTAFGAANYTWLPGPLTGSSVVVSPSLATLYSVAGTSSLGCTSFSNIVIIVQPTPTLTAFGSTSLMVSASSLSLCQGQSATLTATGLGATSYNWMPGNLPGQTIIITPLTSVVYTVTATNFQGCGTSKTVSIAVSPPPVINVISSPSVICPGQSVVFSASGASTYTWYPGQLTGSTVTVTPSSGGVYTVVAGANGCTSAALTSIAMLAGISPTVTTTNAVICAGEIVLLQAGGGITYSWNPSSSVNSPTSPAVLASPTITTIYTVTSSGNPGSCGGTATLEIIVYLSPTLTVPLGTPTACQGNSLALSANGAISYTWAPGNLNGPSITVTPTANTNYTVSGSNGNDCKASAVIHVSVIPGPALSLISTATTICLGLSDTLNVSGALNYTWLPVNQTGNEIVISPTIGTTYTVLGNSNSGCISGANIFIDVVNCSKGVFGVTNAASIPLLFRSDYYKIDFTVTAVNGSNETYTNIKLNSHLAGTFPYPCTYTVVSPPAIASSGSSLSVNSLFDGASELSLTSPSSSTLLPQKRDTITFSILIEPRGFSGLVKNSVVGFADVPNSITASDSSNNGFSWDPDLDGDPTNNNVITIIDIKPIDLFVPQGFSPDGDGNNDLFTIKGAGGKAFKFTVFNRWGNTVYKTEGSDISWDGRANAGATLGKDKLPEGTYYYVLEFSDGSNKPITGFIVLRY
jgi:gliding motility-associated-like protein